MADGRKLVVNVDDTAPGRVIVHLDGELDVGTAPLFRQAVGSHPSSGSDIVLDISGLLFCDSTGLGAMVAIYRAATAHGARLHLCSAQPQLEKTLGVTGLDHVFAVHPDLPSALSAINASRS